MVPRLDPAMRFMFHLACDLLIASLARPALRFRVARAERVGASFQGRSRVDAEDKNRVKFAYLEKGRHQTNDPLESRL